MLGISMKGAVVQSSNATQSMRIQNNRSMFRNMPILKSIPQCSRVLGIIVICWASLIMES
jgi:hypothetical protein